MLYCFAKYSSPHWITISLIIQCGGVRVERQCESPQAHSAVAHSPVTWVEFTPQEK